MTPISIATLKAIAPHAHEDILTGLVPALEVHLPLYGIDTALRLAHFLAQAAHESDGFKTLNEYASGKAYEGRKNLGNIHPGDGPRFKGRGIFQLTGRSNYRRIGGIIGVDLENHPELAATPDIAVRTACEYWRVHSLNALADGNDIIHITLRINGGENGLTQRRAYLAAARKALKI